MPSAGFEPVTPENERLQTHALDRAATLQNHISIAFYFRARDELGECIYVKSLP
jgi:hypothetical protein